MAEGIGSEVEPQYRPISFDDFLEALVTEVGIRPIQRDGTLTWSYPHYCASLTRESNAIHLTLLQDGKHIYGMTSIPNIATVGSWSADIVEFLNGPNPPAKEPNGSLKADKQKIEKWQREMLRIEQQVFRLMNNRRWSQVYNTVIQANPSLAPASNALVRYTQNIYVDFAVLAIRRQAKPQKDSVSLFRLIEDIARHPKTITRAWFRSSWHGNSTSKYQRLGMAGPFVDRFADRAFLDFSDISGELLSPHKANSDLWSLFCDTETAVTYSDKVIAHDDQAGFNPELHGQLSPRDLDIAVLTVEYFTRKYSALLFGRSTKNMTPMDYGNSATILRIPWIQSDDVAFKVSKIGDSWKNPI